MHSANKDMMLNEIKTNGKHTIFDPEDNQPTFKKDLEGKLGLALERNEVIHRSICTKISRLIGSANTPVTLQLLTPFSFKLEGI